jgi:hypothetical protein
MPDGAIALDATGRVPGRGAYLCRDAACFDLAGRRRALAHALGTQIPADIETLIAGGPDGLPAPTTQPRRTADPRLATPTSTLPEGEAHGQE